MDESPVEKEKVFCPIPWNYVFVATNGSLLSCVIASSTSGRGMVEHPDGGHHQVGRSSLMQFRNSAALKDLRRNMLAGKESPEICRRCITEERLGLVSRRNLEKKKNYFSLQNATKLTAADGGIDPEEVPVAVYNMRLGNHCNLTCGTCGPSQSSAWYQEWYDTQFKGFRDGENRLALTANAAGKVALPNSPYYWYRTQSFWEEILQASTGPKELHFSGGEPFLNRYHIQLLERLVASGVSDNIILDYNTNLTVLPEELISLWSSFRKVTIGVSVDGIGEMNDYVRFPSRFEKIESHLRRLDALPDKISFWVTTTLCAWNVGSYPDLIRWILDKSWKRMNRFLVVGGERELFLSYHMLRKPEALRASILPESAKALVRERFMRFMEEMEYGDRYPLKDSERSMIRSHLKAILDSLETETPEEENLRAQFLRKTIVSDRYRKTSFERIEPEIWSLLRASTTSRAAIMELRNPS